MRVGEIHGDANAGNHVPNLRLSGFGDAGEREMNSRSPRTAGGKGRQGAFGSWGTGFPGP